MKHFFLMALALTSLSSCYYDLDSNGYTGTGWKPVYATSLNTTLTTKDQEPITKAGKIVVSGTRLYQTDVNKGIHIYDMSQPAAPQHLKFIQLEGCTDFALKGSTIFANQYTDLVSIDCSNLQAIKLLGRNSNVYDVNQSYPPYSGYFECVDKSKGYVLQWVEADLKEAQCNR